MVSKSGYKYRNWNDLPPNAHDVQLVLYPESDTGPDYKSTTKIPSLDSLLNHPVPSLHVDWVITPPNHTPTTSLSTGRLTVLAFDWDEDKTKPQAFAADLAKICSAADAVPIIIYTPESTPSGVRAVLPDLPPNLCVGIDHLRCSSCQVSHRHHLHHLRRNVHKECAHRLHAHLPRRHPDLHSNKASKASTPHLLNWSQVEHHLDFAGIFAASRSIL